MADKERKMYNFPGNARSDVWKHFGFYAVDDNAESIEVDRSKAICKICRMAIKNHGNTTNLYNHVTKRHGRELALEYQTKLFCEPRFQCIPSSTFDLDDLVSERNSSITNAIFEYIVMDLRPIAAVTSPAFRNILYRLDPKYEIPSNDYFENIHFPRIYEETKQQILQEVQQSLNGCSMKVEMWSALSVTWMSLSIQFIDISWTTKSFLFKSIQITDSPDMNILQEIITNCRLEWNTGTPIAVVSSDQLFYRDNSNFQWYLIPGLAKIINNAALKGFEILEVCQLIDKANKLMRYLENNFKQVIQHLGHVNIDETRWISIYEMFQWLSSNTQIIEDILCGSDTKMQSLDLLFTSEEQILIENLLFAFKELKTASNILCEESEPLVSMILPILQKLLTSFSANESDSSTISFVKRTVHEILSKAYQQDNINLFLIGSSLLDPRYKELPFVSADKRNQAKDLIFSKAFDGNGRDHTELFRRDAATDAGKKSQSEDSCPKRIKVERELITSASSTSVDDWFSDVVCQQSGKSNTDIDRVSTEFNKFQFTDRVSAKSDPLVWWSKHEILFPILSRIAKQFLCTPATSQSASHVFTRNGHDYDISRSLLLPGELDQLIFLNKNFRSNSPIE